MQLLQLWLTDFRNYHQVELKLAPSGLTVLVGRNGDGKTNLLESVGYLATRRSFRGVGAEALVRHGAERAFIRGEGRRAERALLIEVELPLRGRDRVQVNRQPLRRSADLADALAVSVFTPDDLELIKGGPQLRRDYLDEVLSFLHPRHQATRAEVERVLKQRNALLKQAGGNPRPPHEMISTLDVWDTKLASAGEALVVARFELVDTLGPILDGVHQDIVAMSSRRSGALSLSYQPSWQGPLIEALSAARSDDLRRGVSTVGPHRDELAVTLGGFAARTHASQGEQRSCSLALRLASHRVLTEALGSPPILLLDDVFSELDPQRSEALLANLPIGQALLSTAGPVPPRAEPAEVVRVEDGKLYQ